MMKKGLIITLTVLFVFTLSLGVLADSSIETYLEDYGFTGEEGNYNRFEDDGIVWFNEVDSNNPGQYTNLEDLNRSGYYLDKNSGGTDDDQEVSVKLNVDAYIPCYLELKITGNQGTTQGQSFGPNTNPNLRTANGYLMVFDNEIGGFVDENWMSLGAGRNAEVEPGDGVYILGCDIFNVEVYGNEDYKYEVIGDALTAVDNTGDTLVMQMGTSLDSGGTWSGETTFSSPIVETIATGEATESISALHRFRVPYNRSTVHGRYNGEIIFRAVSI